MSLHYMIDIFTVLLIVTVSVRIMTIVRVVYFMLYIIQVKVVLW